MSASPSALSVTAGPPANFLQASESQPWLRRRHRTVMAVSGGCAALVMALMVWLPTSSIADASLRAGPQPWQGLWLLLVGVALAQAGVLALVDRYPALVLAAVASLPLVVLAVPAPVGGLYTLTSIAVLAAVYLATTTPLVATSGAASGAPAPGDHRRPAVVLAAAAVAVGQVLNTSRGDVLVGGPGLLTSVGAGIAQATVVVGLPLLVGSLVTARRAAEAARLAQLKALRREQDALLAAAIAGQRTAMSRELHDIAAHHLSGIALLAAAIPGQVETDPGAAKHSAALVRQQARAVLEDLRRLVGLLREEADASRPVETIEALRALVRQRHDAGVDVDLVLTGPTTARAQQVGPLAQLVAHRMVQEALANATAHSPGAACTVTVDAQSPAALVLRVTNEAAARLSAGRGSGFGLVGMAERAQLVGAALHYGARPGGGWSVALRLPVQDVSQMSGDTTDSMDDTHG